MSFPVTGSVSRSAVNDYAGARTLLASIVTASVVMLTLLFLTPIFSHLPQNVVAAIIIVAMVNLIHLKELPFLVKNRKYTDILMFFVTIVVTVTWGAEAGIFCAVLASAVIVIKRGTNQKVKVQVLQNGFTSAPLTVLDSEKDMSRWDSGIITDGDAADIKNVEINLQNRLLEYCEIGRKEDDSPTKCVLCFTPPDSLYFGNCQIFRDLVFEESRSFANTYMHVIINLAHVDKLDISALMMLFEVNDECERRSIQVYFVGADEELKTELATKISKKFMLPCLSDVMQAISISSVSQLISVVAT